MRELSSKQKVHLYNAQLLVGLAADQLAIIGESLPPESQEAVKVMAESAKLDNRRAHLKYLLRYGL